MNPEPAVFERYMGLHIAVKVSGLTSVTDEDFMVSVFMCGKMSIKQGCGSVTFFLKSSDPVQNPV